MITYTQTVNGNVYTKKKILKLNYCQKCNCLFSNGDVPTTHDEDWHKSDVHTTHNTKEEGSN